MSEVCKGFKKNGEGCAGLTSHPSGYCSYHRKECYVEDTYGLIDNSELKVLKRCRSRGRICKIKVEILEVVPK